VPCPFINPITINVDQYRASSGGWIRLSIRNVNGDGSVTGVQLGKVGLGLLLHPDTFAAGSQRSRAVLSGGADRVQGGSSRADCTLCHHRLRLAYLHPGQLQHYRVAFGLF